MCFCVCSPPAVFFPGKENVFLFAFPGSENTVISETGL